MKTFNIIAGIASITSLVIVTLPYVFEGFKNMDWYKFGVLLIFAISSMYLLFVGIRKSINITKQFRQDISDLKVDISFLKLDSQKQKLYDESIEKINQNIRNLILKLSNLEECLPIEWFTYHSQNYKQQKFNSLEEKINYLIRTELEYFEDRIKRGEIKPESK